ncbi:hypothetical protein HWV62_44251 [Athelia sp. TMB]|nr:hypothetical protein HWV62_25880 [Athelia sp. TMB]KAF7978988.1 hypothetical protein HWV62_44251 [Athelia sp. TMB]
MNYSRLTLAYRYSKAATVFERIRIANDHYAHVARQMRASMSHRQHNSSYRMRGKGWKLRVDTKIAAELANEHVSKVPLPVLDTTPSPLPPRHAIRIPPFHTRPISAPNSTISRDALTSAGTSANGGMEVGHIVHLSVGGWEIPGAPLLKTKELPALSPSDESPSSLNSDSTGLITPEDQPKLATKRKISAMDFDDFDGRKRHLRQNWARTARPSYLAGIYY